MARATIRPVYNMGMNPLWLLPLLLIAACHRTPESEQARLLKRDILRATRSLAKLDLKLKENIEDVGLKNSLVEEQELIKSRLARLVHNFHQDKPKEMPPVWDGKAEEEKGFSEEQHQALKSAKKSIQGSSH